MRIDKRKKRARLKRLHSYLGYWMRCKFLLACFGFFKPISRLTKAESDQLLHRCSRVMKHQIELPPGWESLHKAEVAFGMSLASRVEELRRAKGFRLIKNLGGEIVPIVHMDKTARIIGEKPRYMDCVRMRAEYTLYFQSGRICEYLRDANIEERRIITWDNRRVCCFDRESALLYLEKLMMPFARREGKRSCMKGPRKLEKQQYGGWTIPVKILKQIELESSPYMQI